MIFFKLIAGVELERENRVVTEKEKYVLSPSGDLKLMETAVD